MKNLILLVLLVVVAIAGYNFVNKPVETTEVTTVSEEMAVSAPEVAEEITTTSDVEMATENSSVNSEEAELNLTSPADMPEEARNDMFNAMIAYRKCMSTDKPEYHQQDVRPEAIAETTLFACDPHLDDLKAVLTTNNVNAALTEGMVRKTRSKAARKLIGSIMQAQAMGAR